MDDLNEHEGYSTTRLLSTVQPLVSIHPRNTISKQLTLREGEGRLGEGGLRISGRFKYSYIKKHNNVFIPTESITNNIVEVTLDRDYEELPLITVITVVFNGVKHLDETIKSVIEQTYINLEYIIIDGGSTDGTVDVIRKYEHAIDYWVSEKDLGIYDAMNKAINLAKGDWIYFLGGDDTLIDKHIVSELFDSNSNTLAHPMLIFGKVISDKGKIIKSRLDKKILLHNTLHHQSCFYSKKLFEDFRYNASLKILSDYEINLKAYIKKYQISKVEQIIAMCRDDGISTSKENNSIFVKETNLIRAKYVGRITNFFMQRIFIIKNYIHNAIRHT